MKKFFLFTAAAFAALLIISCNKDDSYTREEPEREAATLTVNIVSDNPNSTKSQGSLHSNQADDNIVNLLELFVFRTDGDDAGMLDAYLRLAGEQLTSLSNINIQTTTGNKIIYAIANSHRDNWTGINTLSLFQEQLSDLKKENIRDFVMTGSVEAMVQATTSVTFSISRLVARVQVASIRTDFAGGPYEGSTLNNVRMYLINVSGDKLYASGENGSAPVILNKNTLVAEDVNTIAMTDMLYDQLMGNITDAGYMNSHYYYTYENMPETETETDKYTRLVIQADLNGHTYYYPVNINQEGFGHVASNGHKGVRRNTAYTLNVVIRRPGSLDPDTPVEHGAVDVSLNVLDWVTTPVANIEF